MRFIGVKPSLSGTGPAMIFMGGRSALANHGTLGGLIKTECSWRHNVPCPGERL